MNKEKLITIRNYSTSKSITTQYAYQLIKNGKLKYKEIDGVKFVIIEDTGYNI